MQTDSHTAIRSALDDYLTRTFQLTDLPGLAVGVGDIFGFDYEWAMGYSDYSNKITLRTDAVFHMASVAKLFVATAMEILRTAGQIHPDDKLTDLLPGFVMGDPRHKKITLRHVLSHTAGIPDIEDYGWTRPETDSGALRRFALSEEVRTRPLLWAPGEGRFQYSNIGFDILGAVLEQATGQGFEACMSSRFFQPLGMRNTTFLSFLRTAEGRREAAGQRETDALATGQGKTDALATEQGKTDASPIPPALRIENFDADHCALPHFKAENRDIERQGYYPYSRAHAPSSTLTSTLRDMKKWGDAHLAAFQCTEGQDQTPGQGPDQESIPKQGRGRTPWSEQNQGRDRNPGQDQTPQTQPERQTQTAKDESGQPAILSRDSYETMWTPVCEVPDNGEHISFGWFIRNQRGHTLYGHEGSDDGFRSSFWICPEKGVRITVLSNITRAPVKKINKGIFDILTG